MKRNTYSIVVVELHAEAAKCERETMVASYIVYDIDQEPKVPSSHWLKNLIG